jgi:CcmD family protein
MEQGGLIWLATTNLIIWTGLFLYLLRIERKLREKEKNR